MITAYLDASALVKLVSVEQESAGLMRFLGQFDEMTTSRVGLIETRRAAARLPATTQPVSLVPESVDTIELTPAIASVAATVGPTSLRTLDAIHLASALAVFAVDAFVTYDARLAAAARAVGLTVAAPT